MVKKAFIKRNKNTIFLGFLSFFLFLVASVYITYPLIFHLGSLSTGIGDELVMAWIQNWVIHGITTNPFTLFQANLYYPYENTLAFAESMIFTSLLAIPIHLWIKEPIAVVNFTFISTLVFLGFSLYITMYYFTKDFFLSLLIGYMVIFSSAVLDHTMHLQILTIQWVPLSILFFFIYLKNQKIKFFIISLIFFLLQAYSSFLPIYFILFSYFIIIFFSWLYNKKQTIKAVSKKSVTILFLALLLVIPVSLPYFQVSKTFNHTRDIRDAIHLALQPEDLLYPSIHTKLMQPLLTLPFNRVSQNSEFKAGYLGVVFSVLVLITLIIFIKRFRKKDLYINSLFSIGLTGLVLSLGPFLHLGRQTVHEPFPVPLPYALLYYIVPGFQGFRNSARWEMLFIIAAALAIGLTLHLLLKKKSVLQRTLLYILLIFGCIVEFNFPMHFVKITQVKDFPKVHSWLSSTHPDVVTLHMPIYNWGSGQFTQNEIWREYYSTRHFRKMVNGYTSFSPPAWQDFIATTDKNFPNEKSLKIIKDLGVDYLIIDEELYDKGYAVRQQKHKGSEVIESLKNNLKVKFVGKFDDIYVFEFVK